jgi:hypothetical protein
MRVEAVDLSLAAGDLVAMALERWQQAADWDLPGFHQIRTQ